MTLIGVFANDPGGTSGIGWGILDTGLRGGIDEVLLAKRAAGSCEVTGSALEQIRKISALWAAFYRACTDKGIAPDKIFYVCENFIFTGKNQYGGDSAVISTAIIWGIEGYRMGRADEYKQAGRGRKANIPPVILQTAGQAKGYATGKRLKEWGLWVVGSDHERSAYQHLAYFAQWYLSNIAR